MEKLRSQLGRWVCSSEEGSGLNTHLGDGMQGRGPERDPERVRMTPEDNLSDDDEP